MKLKRPSIVVVVTAALTALALALPVNAQADDETTPAPQEEFILSFPVQVDAYFSDSFGDPRSEGRSHQGNDLIGDRGTPVVAAADGRIARMTKGTRSGYYVMIDHGDGYTTWYMHLDNDTPGTDDGRGGAAAAFAPGLAVGDPVAAGQVIGYLGDSGNAERTVPHVHFELRLNNRALDPYLYLTAAHERALLEVDIEEGETPFK